MARLDGTRLGVVAALALGAAACSPVPAAMGTGAGGATQAGAGGAMASSASHASSASSTSAVVEGSVGAGGAGAGGGAAACSAPAGTFYAQAATKLGNVSPTPMCGYEGDVLLVVNVASVWVYTPQEAGLQVLEEKFGAQGFHVLGFLSDDFGMQGGTSGQVSSCNAMYGITYQQFAMDHVIPWGSAPAQPVFAWLESQPDPGPDTSSLPSWNFSKYLVSRQGELVAHWDSPEYPGADPSVPGSTFEASPIVMAIEAELAK